MNALKHGLRCAEAVAGRKEIAAIMREVRLVTAAEREGAESVDRVTSNIAVDGEHKTLILKLVDST